MIPTNTPEWWQARLGKVTASRIADLTARTKTGWGASRANYMAELVAERLTSVAADSYSSTAMQWGIDHEAEARAAYEFYRDATASEGGYINHPTIAASGASPDGLVGESGLIEIKCPNTATHIETLLGGTVPEKYIKQMHWQMACSNRTWCDFISYDPRMPESMRLFVRLVERNNPMIADLEKDVLEFLGELDAKVTALVRRYGTTSIAA